MSALEATNAEIRRRAQHEERRRAQRRLAQRPVRAIDALIAELEEMHLHGRKRVPETFDERLSELLEICPAAQAYGLRSRVTIVHLMDQLYEIQELLLEAKAGIEWPAPDGRLPEAS